MKKKVLKSINFRLRRPNEKKAFLLATLLVYFSSSFPTVTLLGIKKLRLNLKLWKF